MNFIIDCRGIKETAVAFVASGSRGFDSRWNHFSSGELNCATYIKPQIEKRELSLTKL